MVGVSGNFFSGLLALQVFFLLMEQRNISIDMEIVRQALETTTWAGRLEKVGQQGQIYLDGAHNLPAIERLVAFIQSLSAERVTILFSALKRKDFREMLEYLKKNVPQARLILTNFAYDGGINEMDCPEGLHYEADYRRFIKEWEENASSDEALFITGSLYFISEVRRQWKDVFAS